MNIVRVGRRLVASAMTRDRTNVIAGNSAMKASNDCAGGESVFSVFVDVRP